MRKRLSCVRKTYWQRVRYMSSSSLSSINESNWRILRTNTIVIWDPMGESSHNWTISITRECICFAIILQLLKTRENWINFSLMIMIDVLRSSASWSFIALRSFILNWLIIGINRKRMMIEMMEQVIKRNLMN